MVVRLNLNSEKLDSDGMFTLQVFLGDISLSDLLIINKMIKEELNERENTLYSIYFK